MKMLGVNDVCMGCGAKESDPECDCEWVTCRCGAWDCWLDKRGDWYCKQCGFQSKMDED